MNEMPMAILVHMIHVKVDVPKEIHRWTTIHNIDWFWSNTN